MVDAREALIKIKNILELLDSQECQISVDRIHALLEFCKKNSIQSKDIIKLAVRKHIISFIAQSILDEESLSMNIA